jgi:hypothetical protein
VSEEISQQRVYDWSGKHKQEADDFPGLLLVERKESDVWNRNTRRTTYASFCIDS